MTSNIYAIRVILIILLGLICFAIIFMSINSSLSCVDKNGCLKSWCNYDWFKPEYLNLIAKNANACPFQPFIPKQQFGA